MRIDLDYGDLVIVDNIDNKIMKIIRRGYIEN